MAKQNKASDEGKAFYVCSTLSQDTCYTDFAAKKPGKDGKASAAAPNVPANRVLIKGGTGVVNLKTGRTAVGVVTKVTADDVELLKSDPHFLRHEERGFVVITDSNDDPEKIVTSNDMETRDNSAQRVPQDFPEGKAPVTDLASK